MARIEDRFKIVCACGWAASRAKLTHATTVAKMHLMERHFTEPAPRVQIVDRCASRSKRARGDHVLIVDEW
jgi:hypothetical protein